MINAIARPVPPFSCSFSPLFRKMVDVAFWRVACVQCGCHWWEENLGVSHSSQTYKCGDHQQRGKNSCQRSAIIDTLDNIKVPWKKSKYPSPYQKDIILRIILGKSNPILFPMNVQNHNIGKVFVWKIVKQHWLQLEELALSNVDKGLNS